MTFLVTWGALMDKIINICLNILQPKIMVYSKPFCVASNSFMQSQIERQVSNNSSNPRDNSLGDPTCQIYTQFPFYAMSIRLTTGQLTYAIRGFIKL